MRTRSAEVLKRRKQEVLALLSGALCGLVVLALFGPRRVPHVIKHVTKPEPGNDVIDIPFQTMSPKFAAFVTEINSISMYGHFDVSGDYKILPYIHKAEKWVELAMTPICAGVQASMDRASWIPKFIDSWPGPLSIALFAPGPEFPLAVHFIRYLVNCYPSVKRQVSIHLVFPVNRPPGEEGVEPDWNLVSQCKYNATYVLDTLLGLRSNSTVGWRKDMEYPQNILRNVAREHCQSKWTTCLDIDMIFPQPLPGVIEPSIYQRLNYFLDTEDADTCDKCAYVIPIFEIDVSAGYMPHNKSELKSLVTKQLARQFHIEVFNDNQKISRLNSKWLLLAENEFVKVGYQIEKYQFWYEPVYIAKRGTPRFDERYLGFGMVRNTQVFEMFLNGYTFHILDNIFLNHWGFQKKGRISKVRQQQTYRNFKIFVTTHLRELAAKYDADPLNMLEKYTGKHQHKIQVMISNEKSKSGSINKMRKINDKDKELI